MLKDDQDTTGIESSVTVRTLLNSGPTLSRDATLSSLSLSGIDIRQFSSGDTFCEATVANTVTRCLKRISNAILRYSWVVDLNSAEVR